MVLFIKLVKRHTNMPPYKLMIWVVEDKPQKYNEVLVGGELVRGIETKFTVFFKNRGEETFPGGKIKYMKANFKEHISHFVEQHSYEIELLEKDKLAKPLEFKYMPLEEGWFWIELAIEAKDNQQIEYYQTSQPNETPNTEVFKNAFNCLSRENLEMLLLLRQISKEYMLKGSKVKKRARS